MAGSVASPARVIDGLTLRKQSAREGHPRGAAGVREKPGLPDADKPAREDVLHEAAEKLHRGQRHRAPPVVVRVILPLKRYPVTVKREQAVIADRDAMGVAAEVPHHGRRPTEGGLCVHDPVRLEERVDEGPPPLGIAELLGGSPEVELAPR